MEINMPILKNLVVMFCASIAFFLKLWLLAYLFPIIMALPYYLPLPVMALYISATFLFLLICFFVFTEPENFRKDVLEWN